MITQQHSASINRADRDLYAREKALNSAIIAADISSGWEEYIQICDAFYADHVEVSDGTESGAVFGRERIRALFDDGPILAWCTNAITITSKPAALTFDDLRLSPSPASVGDQRPS